jgi:hypothetical protein
LFAAFFLFVKPSCLKAGSNRNRIIFFAVSWSAKKKPVGEGSFTAIHKMQSTTQSVSPICAGFCTTIVLIVSSIKNSYNLFTYGVRDIFFNPVTALEFFDKKRLFSTQFMIFKSGGLSACIALSGKYLIIILSPSF